MLAPLHSTTGCALLFVLISSVENLPIRMAVAGLLVAHMAYFAIAVQMGMPLLINKQRRKLMHYYIDKGLALANDEERDLLLAWIYAKTNAN